MTAGVTVPAGFRAAGVAAGLKSTGAPDLALVVNEGPSDAVAAVFTSNRVKAAPVLWSQEAASDGRARAVVLNSGGANACTGPDGFADTHRTAERVAALLSLSASDVLVASTGLIGERLPMDKLLPGVDAAATALALDGGAAAAEAIRTTDSVAKTASFTHPDGWSVGGMAKGAGMLAPGLATMLSVLTTDAVADAAGLDSALRAAVRVTYDRVDSDGCMSTNDTVLLMSSGSSGVAPTKAALDAAVLDVAASLCAQLIADAEGATKEVTIVVAGAATEDDAVEVARSIARNNLLKCALFGNDPNWGRVLAAIGTTRAAFEPDDLDVSINGVMVCRGGLPHASRDLVDLTPRAVSIDVDLHAGPESATVWTNDLSLAYVHENSAYSS
ncbi:MAG: bifunctional glutamate N-acetyltransferase/amino-acid acetyltransferase ArgJ [Pseudonocardiales bacterium]|nr:bifunctional glutamate N-acetyltransferase/amino-acid acetyltransferase ArgJ [Pseudonocardiales bacterium]